MYLFDRDILLEQEGNVILKESSPPTGLSKAIPTAVI